MKNKIKDIYRFFIVDYSDLTNYRIIKLESLAGVYHYFPQWRNVFGWHYFIYYQGFSSSVREGFDELIKAQKYLHRFLNDEYLFGKMETVNLDKSELIINPEKIIETEIETNK